MARGECGSLPPSGDRPLIEDASSTSGLLLSAFAAGLCLYAPAAHLLLIAGLPLPAALLPLCFALGCAAAILRHRAGAPAESPRRGLPLPPAPRVLQAAALLALASLLLPAVWGALATPPRTWDGFAGWWLRARAFTPPADLHAPFFRDPAVFAHSKTYPALLPLLQGGLRALSGSPEGAALHLENLWGPLFFLALCLCVFDAGHRIAGPRTAWLATAAVALTSAWFAPGAAAIDSGYADLPLAFALALAASGLVTKRPPVLAAGILLLPLLKPEGLLWAFLALAALFFAKPNPARPRLRRAALLAAVLAAVLRGLLAPRLLGLPPALSLPLLASLGAFLLCHLLGSLCLDRGPRRVALALAAAALAALAAAAFLAPELAASGDPALQALGRGIFRLVSFGDLPDLVLGGLRSLFFFRKIGFVYLLLFLVLAFRPTDLATRPSLRAFLCLGLTASFLSVPLTAETTLSHEFVSRFGRLLLQWSPVAWIALLPTLGTILHRGPEPRGRSGEIDAES